MQNTPISSAAAAAAAAAAASGSATPASVPVAAPLCSFQDLEKKAEGTFGIFYKVKRKDLGPDNNELYGLKLLKNKYIKEMNYVEIDIGRRLMHPNLLNYLALENVSSCGLNDIYEIGFLLPLKAGNLLDFVEKFNFGTKSKIIVDVACGLAVLNYLGFLHLDIKPENILIEISRSGPGSTMEYKGILSDFGASVRSKEVKSSTLVGTELFLAPEFFSASATTYVYSEVTDIWALGFTFLEILSIPRFLADGIFFVNVEENRKMKKDEIRYKNKISDLIFSIAKHENLTQERYRDLDAALMSMLAYNPEKRMKNVINVLSLPFFKGQATNESLVYKFNAVMDLNDSLNLKFNSRHLTQDFADNLFRSLACSLLKYSVYFLRTCDVETLFMAIDIFYRCTNIPYFVTYKDVNELKERDNIQLDYYYTYTIYSMIALSISIDYISGVKNYLPPFKRITASQKNFMSDNDISFLLSFDEGQIQSDFNRFRDIFLLFSQGILYRSLSVYTLASNLENLIDYEAIYHYLTSRTNYFLPYLTESKTDRDKEITSRFGQLLPRLANGQAGSKAFILERGKLLSRGLIPNGLKFKFIIENPEAY